MSSYCKAAVNGSTPLNGCPISNGKQFANGEFIGKGKASRFEDSGRNGVNEDATRNGVNGAAVRNGVNEMSEGTWVRPDRPRKCTWHLGTTEKSPHAHYRVSNDKLTAFDSILDAVGDCPLVRMSRIEEAEGLKCELYAKCEFMNPGGSVKDRIAMRMIEDAERDGRLKPGYTIIEPTSGNTGIGIALVAAIKGYRCVIVIPDRMSEEKIHVLSALGAEIVRTPSAAKIHMPNSHVRTAYRLQEEIENSVVLQQYVTSGNPVAHYDTTAEEILEQCGGSLDMVIAGTGTGGTISGIGRKMKEKCPTCQVVGVDPFSSLIAQPDRINVTKIRGIELEGMGHDFIPTALDRSVVDKWYKTTDKDSFIMARRLIREEGLLCGGSSGANVHAAVELCRDLEEGQRCVVILPDSVRNYMTRFLMDNWMIERNFMPETTEDPEWWWSHPVSTLDELNLPMSLLSSTTCAEALEIMKENGFDQMPVVDLKGAVLGVIIMKKLMMRLTCGKIKFTDTVDNSLCKFKKVSMSDSLKRLSRLLEDNDFVIVTNNRLRCEIAGLNSDGEPLRITERSNMEVSDHLYGIVTAVDFCQYLARSDSK